MKIDESSSEPANSPPLVQSKSKKMNLSRREFTKIVLAAPFVTIPNIDQRLSKYQIIHFPPNEKVEFPLDLLASKDRISSRPDAITLYSYQEYSSVWDHQYGDYCTVEIKFDFDTVYNAIELMSRKTQYTFLCNVYEIDQKTFSEYDRVVICEQNGKYGVVIFPIFK